MLTAAQQAAYLRLRNAGVDPQEAQRQVRAMPTVADATRTTPPNLTVAQQLALPDVQDVLAGRRQDAPPSVAPPPKATLGSLAKQGAAGVGDFVAGTVAAVPAATAILTGAGREALFPSSDEPIGQRIRQRVEGNPLMRGARALTALPSRVAGEPQNLPEKVARIGGNIATPFLAAGTIKAGRAFKKAIEEGAPELVNETGRGALPLMGGTAGALGGGAYGATQGDTPGERVRNAMLYGTAGAAGGALLGLGAEKIGARYRALRDQGLAPDEARGLLSESGAVGVRPKLTPEALAKKYAKYDDDALLARAYELADRIERSAKGYKTPTVWTRLDPNGSYNDGYFKRVGVTWTNAAGRHKGALDRDGRLIDEIQSVLQARGHDEEYVYRMIGERAVKARATPVVAPPEPLRVAPDEPGHGLAPGLVDMGDEVPDIRPDPSIPPPPEPPDFKRRRPAGGGSGEGGGPLGPDPEDYIGNIRRFQLDPTGEARLREDALRIGPQLQGHPREIQRWVDTKAKSLGFDAADILQTPGDQLEAAKMLAATDRYAENSRALTALYQKRIAGNLGAEEAQLLHANILAFEQENEALLARFIRARTGTGRALNILKTFAASNPDPLLWMAKAEVLHGSPLPDVVRAQLQGFVTAGDRAGAMQLMAKLIQTPTDEKLLSLWKAGLLTSPTTHLANIGGNTTMATLEAMKEAPAAATDWLLGLATGQRSKDFNPLAAASAAGRGAIKGAREASLILRGVPLEDAIRKFDLGRRTNFNNALLDGYVNGVFKSLQAEDRVFRGMALEMALDEQARVLAKIEAKAGGSFADALQRLRAQPTDEMAAAALHAAETATFQNRGALTQAISGFKQTARAHGPMGRAVAAATDVVAPFTNTPLNVALRVGEYAGGGYVAGTINLARLASRVMRGAKPEEIRAVQRLASEQLGRAATGSLAIYLGYRLASRDKITGTRSPKSSERDQMALEGKQPASVQVGDEWHQLQRISPLGNLLVLGKVLYDIQHDPEAGGLPERAGRFGSEVVKGVGEQSFLRGVSGAMEALTNPQDRASAFVRQTATSVVPTVVKRVASGLDPVQRNVKTVREAFMASLPGLRDDLPMKVDQLGQPMQRTGGVLTALFDPTSPTTDRTRDPLIGTLARVGASLTQLKPRSGEHPDAFAERQQATGQVVKAELDKLRQTPAFQALPPEDQATELESVTRKVRALFTQRQKAQYYFDLRKQGVGAERAQQLVREAYGGR